ncbi:glutathione s-transferase omega-1 [Lasius niger]|uniref:Glutathione s-transferase omega-1 n=1 Tax=Lasius niger TaxID=67767 RepID=A0A0J7JZY9_LASNI|nr:glutathione s-transferase omega-1 [Lasius niger]
METSVYTDLVKQQNCSHLVSIKERKKKKKKKKNTDYIAKTQIILRSLLIFVSGSKKPEEMKGQARLYSMKYCPFAHRVRLILTLKQIPHDIVNINLQNKPDWYFQV